MGGQLSVSEIRSHVKLSYPFDDIYDYNKDSLLYKLVRLYISGEYPLLIDDIYSILQYQSLHSNIKIMCLDDLDKCTKLAIRYNKYTLLTILLDNGANINAVGEYVIDCTNLDYAEHYSSKECERILRSRGGTRYNDISHTKAD